MPAYPKLAMVFFHKQIIEQPRTLNADRRKCPIQLHESDRLTVDICKKNNRLFISNPLFQKPKRSFDTGFLLIELPVLVEQKCCISKMNGVRTNDLHHKIN